MVGGWGEEDWGVGAGSGRGADSQLYRWISPDMRKLIL